MTHTSNRFAYYCASTKEVIITEGSALDFATFPAPLLGIIKVSDENEARAVAKQWHATPDNF